MFGAFGSVWCKMVLGEVGLSLPWIFKLNLKEILPYEILEFKFNSSETGHFSIMKKL